MFLCDISGNETHVRVGATLPTCHCKQRSPGGRNEGVGRNSHTSFLTEAALAATPRLSLSPGIISRHKHLFKIYRVTGRISQ